MHPHVALTTVRNASRVSFALSFQIVDCKYTKALPGAQALHPQTHVAYSNQNLSILSLLAAHGFISSVTLGSSQAPHPKAFASAPVSARMLIANLKYRGDRSVIGTLDLVSKPSKRIVVTHEELERLLRGRRVQGVRGVGMGQMLLVKTRNDNWLEGRDALRQGLGGEVMVLVGPE